MENYLDKIRSRPIHERKIILVFSTTAITAIIFLIWFSHKAALEKIFPEENLASAPSSVLIDGFQDLSQTINGGFAEIRNQLGL